MNGIARVYRLLSCSLKSIYSKFKRLTDYSKKTASKYRSGLGVAKRSFKRCFVFLFCVLFIKLLLFCSRLLIIDFSQFRVENIFYDAMDAPDIINARISSNYKCLMDVVFKDLEIKIKNNSDHLVTFKRDKYIMKKDQRIGFDGSLEISFVDGKNFLQSFINKDFRAEVSIIMSTKLFSKFKIKRKIIKLFSLERAMHSFKTCLKRIEASPSSCFNVYLEIVGQLFPNFVCLKFPRMSFKAKIFGQSCVLTGSQVKIESGNSTGPICVTFLFEKDFDLNYLARHVHELINEINVDKHENKPIHICHLISKKEDILFKFFFNLTLPIKILLENQEKMSLPRFSFDISKEDGQFVCYLNFGELSMNKKEIFLFHGLYNSNFFPLEVKIEEFYGLKVEKGPRSISDKSGKAKKELEGKPHLYKNHTNDGNMNLVNGSEFGSYSRNHMNLGHACTIHLQKKSLDHRDKQVPFENFSLYKDTKIETEKKVKFSQKNISFKISVKIESWKTLMNCFQKNKIMLGTILLRPLKDKQICFFLSAENGIFFDLNDYDKPGTQMNVSLPKLRTITLNHKIEIRGDKLTISTNNLEDDKNIKAIRNCNLIYNDKRDQISNIKKEKKIVQNESSIFYENSFLKTNLVLGCYVINLSCKNRFYFDGEFLNFAFDGQFEINSTTEHLGNSIKSLLFSKVEIEGEPIGSLESFFIEGGENLFIEKVLNLANLRVENISDGIRFKAYTANCHMEHFQILNSITMKEKLFFLIIGNGTEQFASFSLDLNESSVVWKDGAVIIHNQYINFKPDLSSLSNLCSDLKIVSDKGCKYAKLLNPLVSRLYFEKEKKLLTSKECLDINLFLDVKNALFHCESEINLPKSLVITPNMAKKLPGFNSYPSRGLQISWPDMKLRLYYYDEVERKERNVFSLEIGKSTFCLKPLKYKQYFHSCQQRILKIAAKVFFEEIINSSTNILYICVEFSDTKQRVRANKMSFLLRKFIHQHNGQNFDFLQVLYFITGQGLNEETLSKTKLFLSHSENFGNIGVEFVNKSVTSTMSKLFGLVSNLNLKEYPERVIIRLKTEKIKAVEILNGKMVLFGLDFSIDTIFTLPITYDDVVAENTISILLNYSIETSDIKHRAEKYYVLRSSFTNFIKNPGFLNNTGLLKIKKGKDNNRFIITVNVPGEVVLKKGHWPFMEIIIVNRKFRVFIGEYSEEKKIVFYVYELNHKGDTDIADIILSIYHKNNCLFGKSHFKVFGFVKIPFFGFLAQFSNFIVNSFFFLYDLRDYISGLRIPFLSY